MSSLVCWRTWEPAELAALVAATVAPLPAIALPDPDGATEVFLLTLAKPLMVAATILFSLSDIADEVEVTLLTPRCETLSSIFDLCFFLCPGSVHIFFLNHFGNFAISSSEFQVVEA